MWISTLLNFRGIRLSAFLSSSGAIAGTVIPGAAIILMAAGYVGAGRPVMIHFSPESLVPSLGNLDQLMLLSGMMVALSGMEMPAIHVTEMANPSRTFPRAIFSAAAIVILLSILGALAIALVVPPDQISLAAGADQAFHAVFKVFHIEWMTPVMSFLLAYGAVTMVATWVLGPSKGMLEVAREGYLPDFWQQRNKYGIPTRILTAQGIISSLLAMAVLFMPTVSGAFWIMSALTAQLYMVMYLFMFAAAIKLRYSQPERPRPYRIPGGKFGIWLVSGIAFLTALFAIITGFIPTPGIRSAGTGHVLMYIGFLLFGSLVFITLPIALYCFYEKRHGRNAAAGSK